LDHRRSLQVASITHHTSISPPAAARPPPPRILPLLPHNIKKPPLPTYLTYLSAIIAHRPAKTRNMHVIFLLLGTQGSPKVPYRPQRESMPKLCENSETWPNGSGCWVFLGREGGLRCESEGGGRDEKDGGKRNKGEEPDICGTQYTAPPPRSVFWGLQPVRFHGICTSC